jgi:3-hydroxyacyl-CoA dehydrogenase
MPSWHQWLGHKRWLAANTSTIPLAVLIALRACQKALQPRFAITHFFNPVRYMRLLELVGGPHTAPATSRSPNATYAISRSGNGVVVANDTPGFIANRLGTYWLHAATTLAISARIFPLKRPMRYSVNQSVCQARGCLGCSI